MLARQLAGSLLRGRKYGFVSSSDVRVSLRKYTCTQQHGIQNSEPDETKN